ncbi:hypothetical protein EVB27_034 [Rhizobium phage RHph_TM16]|nr:hypothetical protein EVB27_034 [Rhizobium phage RHph_TM16]
MSDAAENKVVFWQKPTKKRYRENERSKAERRLLRACDLGPLIRVRNSYYSPHTRYFFNYLPATRTAKALGLSFFTTKYQGLVFELIHHPHEPIDPSKMQQIAREYALAYNLRKGSGKAQTRQEITVSADHYNRMTASGATLETIIELGLIAWSLKEHFSGAAPSSQDAPLATPPSLVSTDWG